MWRNAFTLKMPKQRRTYDLFTSDLHFGHEHIIQFNHRPFRNVTEMNRQLISNYNAVVQPEDTVYLLGDLSFQISVEKANALIAQLNGKKHLILGNHDKSYAPELFEEILIYRDLREMQKWWVLMHYPLLEWRRERHGAIHLHGHIHSKGLDNNLSNLQKGIRRYDVGVDANGYYPVAMSTILDFFQLFTLQIS